MSQGRPRDPRKEQIWRDHLHRWQGSGLAIRAYAATTASPKLPFWSRTPSQIVKGPQKRRRDAGRVSAGVQGQAASFRRQFVSVI